jgi:hypothetical protein
MWRQIRFLSKRTKLQLLKNGLPPKVEGIRNRKRETPVDSKIDSSVENHNQNPEHRMYWYSDPHLLSEAIEKIFKSPKGNTLPLVLDLIQRHSGAATAPVFGLVFRELLSMLNSSSAEAGITRTQGTVTTKGGRVDPDSQEIAPAFHQLLDWILERKIVLTDQGKTSVLALLCELPSPHHPKEFLNINNSTHLALYFKYSSKKGSAAECIQLYQDFIAKEKPTLELCTGLMMVLAKKPSAEHWKFAKTVFRSLKEFDSLFLTSYLQLLYPFEPLVALELIHEHYGYPKTHKESLQPGRFRMELPTLTVLLYVAAKLQYPRLAQRWLTLSGFQLDSIGKRALADVYLQSKQYEMAWNTFHDDAEFGLRICALGARSKDPIWYERSKELQVEGYRSIVNCLWTFWHLQKKTEGLELITTHRTVLLDDVLRLLENCIVEKKDLDRSDLFRIQSVRMIQKFLVADSIVVRLLRKKCTEIEEMMDLYHQGRESTDTTESSPVIRDRGPKVE